MSFTEDFQHRWDRILPTDEMVSDRFEKAKLLNFGRGSSIYHNSYVYGKVQVGRDCWIGPLTLLDGSGGILTLGDFVCISTGVQIYTHETIDRFLLGDTSLKTKMPTTIESNCYIGPNTIVACGVKVGHHSVVAGGSVLLSGMEFRPYSLIAGAPATRIGSTEERIQRAMNVAHID